MGCGSCRPRNKAGPAQTAHCRHSKWPARPPAPFAKDAWLPRSTRFHFFLPGGDGRVSFLVKPVDLPERSLVKGRGQLQQTFADEVKEKPDRHHAERAFA